MRDVREEILVRISEVLGSVTVDGLTINSVRDRGMLPKDQRPASYLLDGVEKRVAENIVKSSRGPALTQMIMELEPQIFVELLKRPEVEADLRGPELSRYRMAVLKALMEDSALINLVGSNGNIIYRGCDTDMQSGNLSQGELQFFFAFRYVLDPSHL